MEEIFLSKFDNIDENEIIKNIETPKVEEKINKPIEKEIIKNIETPKVEEKINKPIEKEVKQKAVKKQPVKQESKKQIKEEPVKKASIENAVFIENKKVVKNTPKEIKQEKDFAVFNVQPKKQEPQFYYDPHNANRDINISFDLTRDQLRVIKIKTQQSINDINLDLIILNNLLSDTTNEYYQIYKNKMSLLKSELNFFQQKERIIDNMIKRK